jgi:hypothetical protein
MAEPQKPEEKHHMGAVPYDVDLLSNNKTEEIYKSLWLATVNVIMKSRMREIRTYGSEKDFAL